MNASVSDCLIPDEKQNGHGNTSTKAAVITGNLQVSGQATNGPSRTGRELQLQATEQPETAYQEMGDR